MLNLKTKIATAAVSGVLLMSAITPAFASTDIQLSGNGSDSDNDISVMSSDSMTLTQSNSSNISNDIRTSSNTGGNSANGNTGGDVLIETGDASSVVGISNTANENQANLGHEGNSGNTDVNVSGNGSDSDNTVRVEMNHEMNVSQENDSEIDNTIDSRNNSGDNRANDNTGRWNGGGSFVGITTGDTNTEVLISNQANSNSVGSINHMNNMWMWSHSMNNGMNSWMSDFQSSMHSNMRMR